MNAANPSAARTGFLIALISLLCCFACQNNDDGGSAPHPLYGEDRKAWRQTGFHSFVSIRVDSLTDTLADQSGTPAACRADDLYEFYENGELRASDGGEPCADQTESAEFSSGVYEYNRGRGWIAFSEMSGQENVFDDYAGDTLAVRLLDEERLELRYEKRETFNNRETTVRADLVFERADDQ